MPTETTVAKTVEYLKVLQTQLHEEVDLIKSAKDQMGNQNPPSINC